MAFLHVSEMFMSPWVMDTPLVYEPGYGPTVSLRLAYTYRRDPSPISDVENQGASVGTHFGASWLSWAEVDDDSGAFAAVRMPLGEWSQFNFSGSSTTSGVEFRRNLILEKNRQRGIDHKIHASLS